MAVSAGGCFVPSRGPGMLVLGSAGARWVSCSSFCSQTEENPELGTATCGAKLGLATVERMRMEENPRFAPH